jgi:4-amino-4-deoxy-L-arabinose transferase-like glycosyltransferase
MVQNPRESVPLKVVDRIAVMSPARWMALVVCTALAIRLAWGAAIFTREPRFDEVVYISHAVRLAEGKGYRDEAGRPETYWPVGYPAVLAATYAVAGQGRVPGFALQAILAAATCILVSVIGTGAFGPRVGRLGALLLAIYPTHVFYSTLHLTEPLFTLLFLASVALLVKGTVSGATATAAGGFVLGLAALVRPVVVLLPVALPIWYWPRGRVNVLRDVLLVGSCSLIALSPWLVRNHGLTGSWTVLSTNGGHTFWIGNHPGAFGGYAYRPEINEALRDGSSYDYERGYRLGFAASLESPVRAVVRALGKATYFFALETDGVLWNLKGLSPPPPMGITLLLLAMANVAYLLLLSLAVLGLLSAGWTHPLASLFLILSGYLCAVAMVFTGDPRYHYPLVPMAAIFAAKGWDARRSLLVNATTTDPGSRRQIRVWAVTMAVLLSLMAANLLLKMLEFRELGSH